MGLDNGIKIRKAVKEDLMTCPTVEIDEEEVITDYGLCYWRKCWGIRNMILGVLHTDENGGGYFRIEYDDIPAILRGLKKFLQREYWEEYADSIWEYDDIIDGLIEDYIRLTWLGWYLDKHRDVVVEFYDSY